MIELTKQQFDVLCSRLQISNPWALIITKQLISMNNPVICDAGVQIDNIWAFNYNDLYYTSNANTINIVASLGNGFTESDNTISYTGSSMNGLFYVIYNIHMVGDVTDSCVGLFSSPTNLVSVDYVGSLIPSLNFDGIYNNLEYIDLSNNITLFSNAIYNINPQSDSKNISFGNFNAQDIEQGAFSGLSIKKVVLPTPGDKETYTIPNKCFENCTQLEEVVIPDGVTSIGSEAFSGCSNLKYVYIGADCTSIGDDAFTGCKSVDLKFEVSYNNTKYLGEKNALLEKIFRTYGGYSNQLSFKLIHANRDYLAGFVNSSDVHYVHFNNYRRTGGYNWQDLRILPGMFLRGGASGSYPDTVTYYDGTVAQGTLVTDDNLESIRGQYGYTVYDNFDIPSCCLVEEIGKNACAGDDNITNGTFCAYYTYGNRPNWSLLSTIGEGAFKKCTQLIQLALPCTPSATQGTLSFPTSLTISKSAFEGCTALQYIEIDKATTFGEKAFFDCTSVSLLRFHNWTPTDGCIGNMAFGNTTSLNRIENEGYNNGVIAYYNGTFYNVILNEAKTTVVLGCAGSDLAGLCTRYPNLTTIGDGAFYGCTGLTIANLTNNADGDMDSSYRIIGNNAFYGCTGLVNSSSNYYSFPGTEIIQIGNSAFYGCTGLQSTYLNHVTSIGNKAFANSGIKHVFYLQPQTFGSGVFDGCTLETFVASGIGSNSILSASAPNVENSCLLRATPSSDNALTLIKSGIGKQIVNTQYYSKDITTIAKEAFKGVELNPNAGDTPQNNVVNIPSSVKVIGEGAFSGSTLNGNKKGRLLINGETNNDNNKIVNDGISKSLLFLVGGKYFKNLVENTQTFKNSGYSYFDIVDGSDYINVFHIYGDNQSDSVKIATIAYNNGDIVLTINYKPYVYYDKEASTTSKLVDTQLDRTITLMYYRQIVTDSTEQSILFENGITPGTIWCGHQIPDDLNIEKEVKLPNGFNSSSSSFEGAKWIKYVTANKRINNLKGAFKGTDVETINCTLACDGTGDYSIFGGIVPESMFEKCTYLPIIVSGYGNPIIPLRYSKNCFKGCQNIQGGYESYIYAGTQFNEGAFAESNISAVDFTSAISIDATAFKKCPLSKISANNIGGEYFDNGETTCICDNKGVIVLGTCEISNRVINAPYTKGIGSYAFAGRKVSNFQVGVDDINGRPSFPIGESAFEDSNITEFSISAGTSSVISKNAFKGSLLQSVQLSNTTTISEGSFAECSSLTIVKQALSNFPKDSFKKCTGLTSIDFINATVNESAFEGCTSLATLNLSYNSASNATINPTAFIGCHISNINIEDGGSDHTSLYTFKSTGIYAEAHKRTVLVIGKQGYGLDDSLGIKEIGEHAYDGRGLSGAINIPNTVTVINNYAFANNPNITRVYIPSTVEYIGDSAFEGCTNIEFIMVPDSCEHFGKSVFKGCSLSKGINWNSVDLRYSGNTPNWVQEHLEAGSNYKGTLDLTYCSKFDKINAQAFAGSKIYVVKLPKVCTIISDGAFSDCSHLSALYINTVDGDSIKIGNRAFYGCNNLADIYVTDTVIPELTGIETFYGAGTSVDSTKRHLFWKAGSATYNSEFRNSDFYNELVKNLGYEDIPM